jgi:D-amino-acid dehydrogenase
MASQISIARIGARIRISGGAEMGGHPAKHADATVRQLYRARQETFPGAANFQQAAQTWKGASLHSSDALPLIGPSAVPGVHFNMAHGNNGWGMACGSARLLADLISGNTPALNAAPFSPLRFRT